MQINLLTYLLTYLGHPDLPSANGDVWRESELLSNDCDTAVVFCYSIIIYTFPLIPELL